MKALILNSGIGKRMGELTRDKPKCMVEIGAGYSIISWQLSLLQRAGIREAVITTGPFAETLIGYIHSIKPEMELRFVANPDYASTNYIYSIDCARDLLRDDILLLHGDLVIEPSVIVDIMTGERSCVAIDSTLPLPEKDFKARIEGDRVKAVGIEYFGADCAACQPIYHMKKADMVLWLDEIALLCARGDKSVYAEKALNNITDRLALYPFELDGRLCNEIDNAEDLNTITPRFRNHLESERISL